MREARNRAVSRHYPVQEQTETASFKSAAPGLPTHQCGGGIMPECVNMDIRPGRLELRMPMRKIADDMAAIDIAPIQLEIEGEKKDYLVSLGKHGELHLLADDGDIARIAAVPDDSRRIYLINIFSDLNAVNLFDPQNKAVTKMLEGKSQLRGLGIGKPYLNHEYAYRSGQGGIAVGVEHVVKNAKGIITRSSGIARTEILPLVDYVDTKVELDSPVTHLRFHFSVDDPNEMYMLVEIAIKDWDSLTSKLSKDYYLGNVFWYRFLYPNAESYEDPTRGDFIAPPAENLLIKNGYRQIRVQFSFLVVKENANLSLLSGDYEDDEDNYNLVPMENVLCKSGNRLWGSYGDKVVYSNELGQPTQEQRKPSAMIDADVGSIADICALGDDIYIFGAKGVAKIDSGRLDEKPRIISLDSSPQAMSQALPSFGIFARLDYALMFFDAGTLAYGTDCKGIDINVFIGNLAKYVKDLETFRDSLYFIAGTRLFKINTEENLGISEIRHANMLIPISIANLGGKSLAVLYSDGVNGGTSVWGIMGDSSEYGTAEREDTGNIRYSFATAISAVTGFVEHSDTHLCARLPEGAAAAVQDVCDGFVYPRGIAAKAGRDTGQPRDYILPAGKDGWQRPIGRSIAMRVCVDLPSLSNQQMLDMAENRPSIYGIKTTAMRQEEVLNPNFCPNRITLANMLASEQGVLFVTEDGKPLLPPPSKPPEPIWLVSQDGKNLIAQEKG